LCLIAQDVADIRAVYLIQIDIPTSGIRQVIVHQVGKRKFATSQRVNAEVSANAIVDAGGAAADVEDNVCVAEDVNAGATNFGRSPIGEGIADGQAGEEFG
jgi:hypothetical protein